MLLLARDCALILTDLIALWCVCRTLCRSPRCQPDCLGQCSVSAVRDHHIWLQWGWQVRTVLYTLGEGHESIFCAAACQSVLYPTFSCTACAGASYPCRDCAGQGPYQPCVWCPSSHQCLNKEASAGACAVAPPSRVEESGDGDKLADLVRVSIQTCRFQWVHSSVRESGKIDLQISLVWLITSAELDTSGR